MALILCELEMRGGEEKGGGSKKRIVLILSFLTRLSFIFHLFIYFFATMFTHQSVPYWGHAS